MFAGTGLEVYHTATPSVLESVGYFGKGCAIHLYRPDIKPNKLMFKGTVFKQDLHDWILANAIPKNEVVEYTSENGKVVCENWRQCCSNHF